MTPITLTPAEKELLIRSIDYHFSGVSEECCDPEVGFICDFHRARDSWERIKQFVQNLKGEGA